MRKYILFLLVLGIFLIGILPSLSAVWSSSIINGTTHFWEANTASNNFKDLIGTCDGELMNGASVVSGAPFGVKQIKMDGINDYVNLTGCDPNNLPHGTHDFTILIGMNLSGSAGASTTLTPLGWNVTGQDNEILVNSLNQALHYYVAGTAFAVGLGYYTLNIYSDILWTRNSTTESVYINGILANINEVAPRILSSEATRFGRATDAVLSFNGTIYKYATWNRTINASDAVLINNSYGIPTPALDTLVVSLDAPANATDTLLNSYTFNSSYSVGSGDFVNSTLFLWYQNGSLFNSNYSVVNTALNTSNLSLSNIPLGYSYQWNYYVCVQNTTDNNCEFSIPNRTIIVSSFHYNNVTFNRTSFETKSEKFILNVTKSSGVSLTSAILYYNGTSHTSTASCIGDECIISNTFDVPLHTSNIFEHNNTFVWNLTIGSSVQTIKNFGQNVSMITFGECNTTLNIPFLNMSFKDENNLSRVYGSMAASTWVYYIGSGSVNRTLIYSNTTEGLDHLFCFSANRTMTSKTSIQYESTNYPQRIYSNTLSLPDTSLSKLLLYLLGSTDGIYVTFQVINGNTEQVIAGVNIVGTRSISGSDVTVAIGTTDAAGSATFWLNPDYSHTFNFSKIGYEDYITSIFPTQSSYTISMGGTSIIISNDYTQGVSYQIKPSGDYLKNNTIYNFNFTLSSTYWNVNEFGFKLYYKNGSLAGQTSAVTNGGIVFVNANTYNQSNIRMDFYYIINSSYYNGTRSWYINNGGTKFSILNFFNDLTLYMDAGIFGIDHFGRIILSIFIIVITMGTLSYRYGIASEAAIFGILFGLIYFFDIGIGLIPPLTFGGNSIPHFITILTGLLMASFIVKEELR